MSVIKFNYNQINKGRNNDKIACISHVINSILNLLKLKHWTIKIITCRCK